MWDVPLYIFFCEFLFRLVELLQRRRRRRWNWAKSQDGRDEGEDNYCERSLWRTMSAHTRLLIRSFNPSIHPTIYIYPSIQRWKKREKPPEQSSFRRENFHHHHPPLASSPTPTRQGADEALLASALGVLEGEKGYRGVWRRSVSLCYRFVRSAVRI